MRDDNPISWQMQILWACLPWVLGVATAAYIASLGEKWEWWLFFIVVPALTLGYGIALYVMAFVVLFFYTALKK
jgi:hypothetical protein